MPDGPELVVVGIGASAGGIPAMQAFFQGVPRASGMAFVVVTHLSPEHESLLPEVLARYTEMAVVAAEDGVEVQPEHVYVMPPSATLALSGGRLKVRQLAPATRERKPIDLFFASLAEDRGERAVGVILSGGDGDGTLGAKVIKERGGLVMAQSGDGAGPRNPDMPQSAIASGVVDVAVPADAMGRKLVEFAKGFETLDDLTAEEGVETSKDIERAREQICNILRDQSGHDFSSYKTKTFLRRVRRRMQIGQIDSLQAYIERLRGDRREVSNLFSDLLINVTDFFRDAEAFEDLKTMVVPRLFEGKSAADTVRIWVPGCATGEEVYSLGILLCEHLDGLTAAPRVQIFATDIDEAALAVARAARYPANLLAGVSQERRQRFFTQDNESYVIAPEVRELCVFSPHSVIKDPPFSRMDLVSCRNLLIYFGADVQNRIIPVFHHALKPGGYLFLGASESIGQHNDLFATVEKKHRIFRAREHVSPKSRLSLLVGDGPRATRAAPDEKSPQTGQHSNYPFRQSVEARVLERYAPPHVVVNAEGDIVYYSARTGRYLEAAQGSPSRQLLNLARRGLRLDLRAALRESVSTRGTVTRENVTLDGEEDGGYLVNITVEPLPERSAGDQLYLVLFQPVGPARESAAPQTDRADGLAHLERDLRETRERLQSTIEEYETALEELKSSNEELTSVNEEAQSTNEELEASKEEMQSLNEELNTINAELSSKVEDLNRANSDLKNLFESTQIATIFLDRNLVIRTFTPAASRFFNLRATDVGRPLTDLSSELDYPEMRSQIEQVFETGEPIIHHLARDPQGRFYMARLIPYRDKPARPQGVVVTFVDVTPLALAEEHQKVLISELNHRVKNMISVVTSIANRTAKTSSTKEDFTVALLGRLHAMSRAYDALSRESWKEVAIADIVSLEIVPFDPRRFTLGGPPIKLKPHQALSVGMVIHELATNAAKYGALSRDEGKVDIAWSLVDANAQIVWRESNGPTVREPDHSGFGFALIKGEISYRLKGAVETSFEPTGLTVKFSFPLERANGT